MSLILLDTEMCRGSSITGEHRFEKTKKIEWCNLFIFTLQHD